MKFFFDSKTQKGKEKTSISTYVGFLFHLEYGEWMEFRTEAEVAK